MFCSTHSSMAIRDLSLGSDLDASRACMSFGEIGSMSKVCFLDARSHRNDL